MVWGKVLNKKIYPGIAKSKHDVLNKPTIIDRLRKQNGRLALDDPDHPSEHSEKENPQEKSRRSKKSKRSEKRRELKDSRYKISRGFEVCKNRDPARLSDSRRRPKTAPRGWCNKYWWDVENLKRTKIAGAVTCYCASHLQLLESVSGVLSVALQDEGIEIKDNAASHQLPLRYRHQVFRDLGVFPLGQPYLFSSDDPIHPPTLSSEQIRPPSVKVKPSEAELSTKDRRKVLGSVIPSSARHRLYDSRLLNELEKQEYLRGSCCNIQMEIDSSLERLEEVEGLWIKRIDGIPLSHTIHV